MKSEEWFILRFFCLLMHYKIRQNYIRKAEGIIREKSSAKSLNYKGSQGEKDEHRGEIDIALFVRRFLFFGGALGVFTAAVILAVKPILRR